MSSVPIFWSPREELKDAERPYRRALKSLKAKPDPEGPEALSPEGGISAVRYWGYRVRGTLTVVHRADESSLSGAEKSVTFTRDWRDSEIPAIVKPDFASEVSSIGFSPLETDHFDFSRLDEIPETFPDRGRLISAVVNFFSWGVDELNGGNSAQMDGFTAEVTVERYLVADRICVLRDGKERTLWSNANTGQVWELAPSGEIHVPEAENRLPKIALFAGCFLAVAAILWCLSFYRNMVNMPRMDNGIAFGFACVGAAALAGVFIRGWLAVVVSLAMVAFGAHELVPWIGDAWDMTTDAALASFFASAEWQGAPIGATYVASSVVLTLLAVAVVPSLALKVDGPKSKVAASGLLFAAAVSPWPKALGEMEDISALPLRIGICAMLLLDVLLVGQCGWAVSRIAAGLDDLSDKVARGRHPSGMYFLIAFATVLILLWSQIRLML